jgi:AraC-like DNA-binding protein
LSKTKEELYRTKSWLDGRSPTLAVAIEDMRFPINFVVANSWSSDPEDRQTLLNMLGVSAEQAAKPDGTITGNQFKTLMELGLEVLQTDKPLSFSVGDGLSLGAMGVYGFAMMAAENLSEALDICTHYSALVMPALSIERCFFNAKPAVIFRGHPDFGRTLPAMMEITVKLMRTILDMTEMPINLDSLHFTHHPQFPVAMYEQFYGCAVCFGSDENRIVFDIASLDVAFKHRNRATAELLEEQLLQKLQVMHSQKQWSLKVQGYIRDHIRKSATLTREEVAAAFNISPKTLARRLQDEGTHFRQLVDDLRMNIALYALRHTVRPVADIGHEVGFSDVRAFRRAIHRWTGMSAAHIRAEK